MAAFCGDVDASSVSAARALGILVVTVTTVVVVSAAVVWKNTLRRLTELVAKFRSLVLSRRRRVVDASSGGLLTSTSFLRDADPLL